MSCWQGAYAYIAHHSHRLLCPTAQTASANAEVRKLFAGSYANMDACCCARHVRKKRLVYVLRHIRHSHSRSSALVLHISTRNHRMLYHIRRFTETSLGCLALDAMQHVLFLLCCCKPLSVKYMYAFLMFRSSRHGCHA